MGKKKVLITGSTGFVGKKLMERIVREESEAFQIVAFCRSKSSLDHFKGIQIVEGDLMNVESLNVALKDVHLVIHLAAEMNFFPSDPDRVYRINVEGTRNVVESCIKNGVERLVYVSTAETYGAVLGGKPANEESEYHPTSDYGKSKIQSEKVVRDLCKQSKLPFIILEPTGIYGPGDDFAMCEVIQTVNLGLLFFTGEGGTRYLTFTYIDDVLDAILAASRPEVPKEALNETFIIASGENWTYKDWISSISTLVGRVPPFLSLPFFLLESAIGGLRPIMNIGKRRTFLFEVDTIKRMKEDRWYDISKARRVLKWNPKTSTEEGLKKTVHYMFERNQMRRYLISPFAAISIGLLIFILFWVLK